MFQINDVSAHDLSPDATLRTTGGPARRKGDSVNTSRATVQARKLRPVLLGPAGLDFLKYAAKTRNGRRALVNLAYKENYNLAIDAGLDIGRAKVKAQKASYKVAVMLKRRAVHLTQVQAYHNVMRLGTRYDRTDPRNKLFTTDRFTQGYNYSSRKPMLPETFADRQAVIENAIDAGQWTMMRKEYRKVNGEAVDIVKVRGVVNYLEIC